MRRAATAALFLLVCPIALAQFHHHAISGPGRGSPCKKNFATAELNQNLQKVIWPVDGGNLSNQATGQMEEAQKFFSQGMTEYYGFDYEEAMRNFRRATELSPHMAMASWGIALAAGPNINLGMDPGCREEASIAISDAIKEANDYNVPAVEKGLIYALALRYAGPITETVAYSVAMRNLWAAVKDSGDTANVANVGALYAESLIEMRPWALYNVASEAALGTETIDTVLEAAIKAQPKTIGANHFYIHAVEASLHPERGKDSATVLREANVAAGHLIHMPSHIDFLRGEYAAAMKSNFDAAKVDIDQYGVACQGAYADYAKEPKCPQLYYGHYLSHNLFFRGVAAAFNGQSAEAMTSACETSAHAQRFVPNEPGLQRYMTAPLMTMVMNRNWEKILGEWKPPNDCYMDPFPGNGCHILTATWHWARGMAFAANGGLAMASNEYELMTSEMQKIEPPTPTGWGNNSAAVVLAVAESMLQASYTWAGGQCEIGQCTTVKLPSAQKVCGQCKAIECSPEQDRVPEKICALAAEQAIEHLKLAVTHEDAMAYDEPPQWFPPAREALGGAYLRVAEIQTDLVKRRAAFELAADTFKQDLDYHPKSGRALYGKWRALKGAGKSDDDPEVNQVKTDFCTAWHDADYAMTENDLWPAIGGGPLTDNITCTPPLKGIGPPSLTFCRVPDSASLTKAK